MATEIIIFNEKSRTPFISLEHVSSIVFTQKIFCLTLRRYEMYLKMNYLQCSILQCSSIAVVSTAFTVRRSGARLDLGTRIIIFYKLGIDHVRLFRKIASVKPYSGKHHKNGQHSPLELGKQ